MLVPFRILLEPDVRSSMLPAGISAIHRACGGRLKQPWRADVNGDSRPYGYYLLPFGVMPGADLALSSLAGVGRSHSANTYRF
jgi:hypothetical protein